VITLPQADAVLLHAHAEIVEPAAAPAAACPLIVSSI
jgi:hypothetical protein